MRLIFTRHRTPASLAICAATASIWSHVACEIGGAVFEAKAASGVRQTTYWDALVGASRVGVATVDCNNHLARRWLFDQLGKPYDWSAIWSWFGSRDWQADDRWFCFELAATACARGNRRVVYEETARVTGSMLWNSPVIVREGVW